MSLSPVKITAAHKYYNKGKSNQLHVMDNINLELPESGMVAIFGQSGCGKTTLLNAVGGLDRIASGSIEIFGQNIREDTDTLRNRYVGYIFQNYNLNPAETVYENVSAALRLCGMTDETEISVRTMAALSNVDMAKYRDRTPDTLSGGQQQRVAIARAIVNNPDIILADEPTGNLDEANTVLVMDILKEISRSHLVLLVTHEANLVDYYCDRVIEIVDGRVQSDRVNEGANGYVQRNKNHLYLGELPKTETAAPGVRLEYYGEPTESITLQVVNLNGKLYLKTDNPSVKLLDEGSEIKLMKGVFHEAKTREDGTVNGRKLDMSALTPITGERYGRLYHWKNSLVYAWRECFGKKQKKGKKLLRLCLALLAIVMVFMTAGFGAGISSYVELRKDHNEHMFYIPLEPTEDYSAVISQLGNYGMDFARLIGSDPLYDADTLILRASAFMTAQTVSLRAEGYMLDAIQAKDLDVVAGEGTVKEGSADILITTALADKLLESSSAGYLEDYEDLIGLVSANRYTYLNNSYPRVAGVVESDELYYYADSLGYAEHVLNSYFWMPVIAASRVGMEDQVGAGEMLCREMDGMLILPRGEEVTLLGKTFTVKDTLSAQPYSLENYPAFVKETYGTELITDPNVYAETMGMNPDGALYAWLLDHYFTYLPAFFEAKLSTLAPHEDVRFEEWAAAKKQSITAMAELTGYDAYEIGGAYLYRQQYGSYPTTEQLGAFLGTGEPYGILDEMVSGDAYLKEYDNFMMQHWNGHYREYYYVISDEDYMALASSAGVTDSRMNVSTYSIWDTFSEGIYYTNHLMIRSSDPAAAAAFLRDTLGEDGFITPDGVFESLFKEIRTTVLAAVITVGVVLILMCLCVFFIMRSSFMSRVREVGILRAIGVTKKNLVFRFAVETGVLISLTLALWYILSGWFIGSLADAPLFSELFYFPLWMAVGLFAVICAAALFFGVLPAILLLRKTPSEILSKYDI